MGGSKKKKSGSVSSWGEPSWSTSGSELSDQTVQEFVDPWLPRQPLRRAGYAQLPGVGHIGYDPVQNWGVPSWMLGGRPFRSGGIVNAMPRNMIPGYFYGGITNGYRR